jgi:glycosyltransferase involved in cell wall biosynthesis
MSSTPQHGCPKISVVIPTRNRVEFLPYAIETVLSQPETNFELVVSDNHSQDGTADFLSGLRDPRLRIVQPERSLAMVDHFEWVVQQTRGEWVTIIGDDDGLMPFFFRFALPLLETVESRFEVIFGPRAYYMWRGLEEIYGKTAVDFGATVFAHQLNCKRSLRELAQGAVDYFDFPQFYTGTIFHRSLMDRIRSNTSTGRVFNSITPDAASTAALLLGEFKILQIGVPLAWVGSSPKSNGAQTARNSQGSSGDLATFIDFSAMNARSHVRLSDRFRTLLQIGTSAHLYFLEALSSTLDAQRIRNVSWFDHSLPRHLLFAELYRTGRKKAGKDNLPENYKRLFQDNRCHLFVLAALSWLTPVRRLRRSVIRRFDGLLGRRLQRDGKWLRLRVENHSVVDTIVKANSCFDEDRLGHELGSVLNRTHAQCRGLLGHLT